MFTLITWLSGAFVLGWVAIAVVLRWRMKRLESLLRTELPHEIRSPESLSWPNFLRLAHLADNQSDTSYWVTRASRLEVQWAQARTSLLITAFVTAASLVVNLMVAAAL